ncbi:MAG: CoA-transferase [Paracoccaceae bacterium]
MVDYLAADFPVCLHTENGLSGIGPSLQPEKADRNLIDAGGAYVSTVPGSAFFDSAVSFALVRSGRLDLTMLGAFEVSQAGDLANWKIPGKFSPGAGGASSRPEGAAGGGADDPCRPRRRAEAARRMLPADHRPRLRRAGLHRHGGDRHHACGLRAEGAGRGVALDAVVAATGAPLVLPDGAIPT